MEKQLYENEKQKLYRERERERETDRPTDRDIILFLFLAFYQPHMVTAELNRNRPRRIETDTETINRELR